MQKRPILTLVAALAFAGAGAWSAEPKETIEMADGSVYMGHTSRQDLTTGKFQFLYDSATVVRPRRDVSSLTRRVTDFNKLSDAWKRWFTVRPQYVQTDADGKRSVVLYRLVDNDDISTNVFLFSRSPKSIKYYTISAGKAELADDDVKVSHYGRRDELDLTGVVTEIVTTDGETVRGQLVEDSAEGKGILTDDFVVEIIPSDKIAVLRRLPLDPTSGIENQTEYLDQIGVKADKNGKTSYKGIITVMNYKTDGKPDPYVIIYDPNEPDNEGDRVAMTSLVSKAKAANSFYAPLRDVRVTSDSTVLVNGEEMTEAAFQPVKDQVFTLEASKATPTTVTPKDGKVTVSVRDVAANRNFTLIRIEKKTDRNGTFYTYTFRDLKKSEIDGERKVSRNGVANIVYEGLDDGTYLLFNDLNEKAYLFRIGEEAAVNE